MRPWNLAALAPVLFLASIACAQNAPLATDGDGAGGDVLLATAATPQSVPAAPATTSVATPTVGTQTAQTICGITHLVRCIEDLGQDDKGIFTSPLRVKATDAYWLAPLGAATGLAFAYDTDAMQQLGVDQDRINTANNISNFGSFYATGAESAGLYFIGLGVKDPHLTETGRLAAEAVLDSGTVTLATKLVANRQRPLQGNGDGGFWQYGTSQYDWDSSFPSDHATASMAFARVVAGEYPRWYVAAPAYGFAVTVSVSRVLAREHFPSDVLVGDAIGFLTGTYVLDHRATYRPGKKGVVARMMGTVTPVIAPSTRTIGASIAIPTGR
ncbi:MAG: phosphatase PAP2 family protein [Acidobacteriaceae bacterium]